MVFAACAEAGVAVEVNSRPERLDPPKRLLRLAVEAGCRFSIDTDAHAPGQLDWLPYGCERAAACGVTAAPGGQHPVGGRPAGLGRAVIEVRRAADRAVTRTGWLDSRHSFSYGAHYDPANTHFGLLLACNEDRLAAGAGFDAHPHRDVEVVTWVLAGALRHADDAGHRGEARPGVVQRMSAGAGVRHAEHAGPEGAHYVQMWVRPAAPGGEPAYDTVAVGPGLAALSPLRQPAATLHAGRCRPAGRPPCRRRRTCTSSSGLARSRSPAARTGRSGWGRGTRRG